jgi:hypothetical protein
MFKSEAQGCVILQCAQRIPDIEKVPATVVFADANRWKGLNGISRWAKNGASTLRTFEPPQTLNHPKP